MNNDTPFDPRHPTVDEVVDKVMEYMNDTPETPKITVHVPLKLKPLSAATVQSDATPPPTEVLTTTVCMPYLAYRKIEDHLRHYPTGLPACSFVLGEPDNPAAAHPMNLFGATLRCVLEAARPSAARGDKQIRLIVQREVDLQPGGVAERPPARKVRAVRFLPA